jgi:ATP-dependent helicase/nuclease subunit A
MGELLEFQPLAPAAHTPDSVSDRRGIASALPDAAARQTALDTRRSVIVESPAGSGKTGLLIQRVLKLLADETVQQPEEVLAMTFTNKAAAEMRERVLEQLHQARDAAAVKDEAYARETRALAEAALRRSDQLGWSLLDRPQRLNLRTIDSVCAEVANALPLISGAGAPRKPVDEAMPLYRAAARRTLDQLGGTDRALDEAVRTLLLHRDARLSRCEGLIASMLGMREQWAELIPLTPGELSDEELDRTVRPRLERVMESVVCDGLSEAARLLPAGTLQELAQIAASLGELPGYGGENPFALCAQRDLPPEAVAEHLDHWVALITLLLKPSDGGWRRIFGRSVLRVEPAKAVSARLKEIVADLEEDNLRDALAAVLELPPPRYPEEQWHVARALFRILRHALVELRILFSERGECDFTELALAARRALADDDTAPDLALAYGGRLRHLLVDEMQDTSAGQYELIRLLTRSFDGHSQTVFLVGDPKQSIYLFRQARVERFLRTLKERRLGEVPLDAVRLTANFRSQPALVDTFNRTFEPLFARAAPGRNLPPGEIPFVAAAPMREPAPWANDSIWHAKVLSYRATPPRKAGDARENDISAPSEREAQARELREIVDAWRAKPLPPGRSKPWSIAVLALARSHFAPLVAEFQRDRGKGTVPYRAVAVDPLDLRPEVLDALALARALLHPADRVAWLAVLRAPWCGLSLADLLALTGEGVDPASSALAAATVPWLVEHRRHLLSADGQALLRRAWPALYRARHTMGAAPLALQVERTWRSLGGDLLLDQPARTNVRRFFDLLATLENKGGDVDLRALEARMKKLYAEPLAAIDDAVELMTIHKAKGLEWDVVLVPSLDRQGKADDSPLLNWLELEMSGSDTPCVLSAPIAGYGEEATHLYKWLNAKRSQRAAAERRRLFYVACTRAREELHLFGIAQQRKGLSELCKPHHGSLLRAAWPAAEAIFRDAGATTQAAPDAVEPARASHLETLVYLPFLDRFDEREALQLAASGVAESYAPPAIQRLPGALDPRAHFAEAAARKLPYASAKALASAPAFDRPEGSFGVRAFGNVAHRYLQQLAELLDAGAAMDALAAEIPSWQPRLAASLRNEGLPQAQAAKDAIRGVEVLRRTLADPVGRWILSRQDAATSEHAVSVATQGPVARSLRADRILTASEPPPGVAGVPAGRLLWVIDFKTAEQGSRSDSLFAAQQREQYGPQLESYAASIAAAGAQPPPTALALYFPQAGQFLWWLSSQSTEG